MEAYYAMKERINLDNALKEATTEVGELKKENTFLKGQIESLNKKLKLNEYKLYRAEQVAIAESRQYKSL